VSSFLTAHQHNRLYSATQVGCCGKDIIVSLSFYSEVVCLACQNLVIQAANAMTQCCSSAMQHLKTYLRSTVQQRRPNDVMLLHIHKERLHHQLNLVNVGN